MDDDGSENVNIEPETTEEKRGRTMNQTEHKEPGWVDIAGFALVLLIIVLAVVKFSEIAFWCVEHIRIIIK